MEEPEQKQIEIKSPSEILIRVLEDFGRSEPDEVMVIYTNQDGHLMVVAPPDSAKSIGMMEIAKAMMLGDLERMRNGRKG